MTASGWAWFAAAGVLAVIDWIAVGEDVRRLERIAKPLVLLALLGATATTPADDVRGWLIAALIFGVLGDVALSFERHPAPAAVDASSKLPRLSLSSPATAVVTSVPIGTAGTEALTGPAPSDYPPESERSDQPRRAGRRNHPNKPVRGSSGGLFLAGLAAFLVGHLCYLAALGSYGIDSLSVVFGLMLVLIALLSFGYRIMAGAHSYGGAPLTVGMTLYLVALGSVVVFGVATAQLPIAAGVVLFAISDLILGYDRFVQARPWAPLAVIVTYHVAQGLIVLGLVG